MEGIDYTEILETINNNMVSLLEGITKLEGINDLIFMLLAILLILFVARGE